MYTCDDWSGVRERLVSSLAITGMSGSRTNSPFNTLGGLRGTCVHSSRAHIGLRHFCAAAQTETETETEATTVIGRGAKTQNQARQVPLIYCNCCGCRRAVT